MALSRPFSDAALPRAVTARLRGVTGDAGPLGTLARPPAEGTPPGFHVSAEANEFANYCAELARRNKRSLVAKCRRLGIPGNINVPKANLLRRLRAELARQR